MARDSYLSKYKFSIPFILKEFLIEASSYSKYDSVGGLVGQSCFN